MNVRAKPLSLFLHLPLPPRQMSSAMEHLPIAQCLVVNKRLSLPMNHMHKVVTGDDGAADFD